MFPLDQILTGFCVVIKTMLSRSGAKVNLYSQWAYVMSIIDWVVIN